MMHVMCVLYVGCNVQTWSLGFRENYECSSASRAICPSPLPAKHLSPHAAIILEVVQRMRLTWHTACTQSANTRGCMGCLFGWKVASQELPTDRPLRPDADRAQSVAPPTADKSARGPQLSGNKRKQLGSREMCVSCLTVLRMYVPMQSQHTNRVAAGVVCAAEQLQRMLCK